MAAMISCGARSCAALTVISKSSGNLPLREGQPIAALDARLVAPATVIIPNYHLRQNFKGEYAVAKIRPVGDRVVVKPAAKEEITKSGIVIPDTAKEKPQEGTVIAVGSGRLLDNGDRAPIDVREGDRILFAKYGGTEFKLDGEEYLVLKENDILAIIG